jgi:hypothetical protein
MSAPQTSVPTTPAIGVEGQLADLWTQEIGDVRTATSEEASASIAFGRCVKRGTADDSMKILTAITETILGITVYSPLLSKPDELDAVGMTPKTVGSVLRMGRIIVTSEDAVTPASGVFVRALVNGGNTIIGGFRGTADGVTTIDISAFAQWTSSAAAGALAELEVDFLGT